MKNLFALVFLFPLAVTAEEVAPPIVLKLPYSLETSRNPVLSEENAPVIEHQWLLRNCCTHTEEKVTASIFTYKERRSWFDWLRNLREKQRVGVNVFDSEATLSVKKSGDGAWNLGKVGKHGRVYGIEYRKTTGILDGSPRSLDFITRWFSFLDDP